MRIAEKIKHTLLENKELTIIILAFLMALIPQAGKNSYWLDELYSVYVRGITYNSFFEQVQFYWINQKGHPLYEFNLFLWMKLFGHSEASTRLLSVIYSALAAVFLYLFVGRLWGKRIAVSVVLMTMASYMVVCYSLETRYYTQMLFLTALSSYLLLRYMESLAGHFSWKNLFRNRFFLMYGCTNAALILNHTLVYLFIASQAVFLLVFFLSTPCKDSPINKMIKTLALFLSQLLITAIIWHPAFSFLWKQKAINHLKEIISDISNRLVTVISLRDILLLALFLIVIIVLILLIRKKLLPIVSTWVKGFFSHIDAMNRNIFFFYSLSILVLTFLFTTNYGWLQFMIKNLFTVPLEIINNYVISQNLSLSNYSLTIIMIFLGLFVLKQFYVVIKKNLHSRSLLRQAFVVYIFYLVLLPSVFAFLLLSLIQLDKFASRYIIYCIPPLMIILVLSLDQGFRSILFVFKELIGFSFSRLYVRYYLLPFILFAWFAVWPGAERAATRVKTDWRGIALSIVQEIEANPNLDYLIYETTFQDAVSLDYYLQRYSNSIRTYGVTQRLVEDSLAADSSYIPRILNHENMKAIIQNDFLMLVFTHHTVNQFPHTVGLLSETFTATDVRLDNAGRGYLLFKTH